MLPEYLWLDTFLVVLLLVRDLILDRFFALQERQRVVVQVVKVMCV